MDPERNIELLHKHKIGTVNTLTDKYPLTDVEKTGFFQDSRWYNLLPKIGNREGIDTSSFDFDLCGYSQGESKDLDLHTRHIPTCLTITNTHIRTYSVTDNPTITYEQSPSASVRSKINETILEWWAGKIIDISYDEKYFTVDMTDSKGTNSIMELDFQTAFGSEEDMELNLFKGARLTFCVLTKHQSWRAPILTSQLEFVPPYIWREADNEKVEKAIGKLFPEELEFDD